MSISLSTFFCCNLIVLKKIIDAFPTFFIVKKICFQCLYEWIFCFFSLNLGVLVFEEDLQSFCCCHTNPDDRTFPQILGFDHHERLFNYESMLPNARQLLQNVTFMAKCVGTLNIKFTDVLVKFLDVINVFFKRLGSQNPEVS